ncbi:MAG: hypothetical protein J2P37_36555 [Ktedonobacteraceae bacterium]|nr:hypothetical protein [Ktedonobacteraceae bacterium]
MNTPINLTGNVTLVFSNEHLEAIVGHQVSELNKDLMELHRRLDELVQRVDTQIAHVNENLRDLDRRLTGLVNDLPEDLEDHLRSLEGQVSDLETKIDDLPDVEGMDSRLDDLERKVEDMPDPNDIVTTDNVNDILEDADIGHEQKETIADISRNVKQLMKLRQVLADALTSETV